MQIMLATVCNLWFHSSCSVPLPSVVQKEIAMGVTALRSVSMQFPSSDLPRRVEPFRSAEEAWFWTMAALMARREGARYTANQGRVSRPCEADDVVKCLDGLYRRRR